MNTAKLIEVLDAYSSRYQLFPPWKGRKFVVVAHITLEDGTELLKIKEDELKELLRHHPYMKEVLSRYHLDRVTATADTLKNFLKNGNLEGIVS